MHKKIILAAALATLSLIGALRAAEQAKPTQAQPAAASCCDGGACCAPDAACCAGVR